MRYIRNAAVTLTSTFPDESRTLSRFIQLYATDRFRLREYRNTIYNQKKINVSPTDE